MKQIEYNIAVIDQVVEKMEFVEDLDFITNALEASENSDKFVRAVQIGDDAEIGHWVTKAVAEYKRRFKPYV